MLSTALVDVASEVSDRGGCGEFCLSPKRRQTITELHSVMCQNSGIQYSFRVRPNAIYLQLRTPKFVGV
jgi:hypothetical protein